MFNRPKEAERDKHIRRDSVSAVAFLDDGPGMLSQMARYALSRSGDTRFEEPFGIGKFGFGLPSSSSNPTRSAEVYTKAANAEAG